MLNFLNIFKREKNKIDLEDRIQDMQIDLRHIKAKIDIIAYYLQKTNKEGLKIKR